MNFQAESTPGGGSLVAPVGAHATMRVSFCSVLSCRGLNKYHHYDLVSLMQPHSLIYLHHASKLCRYLIRLPCYLDPKSPNPFFCSVDPEQYRRVTFRVRADVQETPRPVSLLRSSTYSSCRSVEKCNGVFL